MNNQSSNQGLSGVFIGLGVLLIVMGVLFVVGQAAGFDLRRFGWPFFVIIPGLALSGVGLAAGGPTGERITPLGAAVTMVGVILPTRIPWITSRVGHTPGRWFSLPRPGWGRSSTAPSREGRRWSRPAGAQR